MKEEIIGFEIHNVIYSGQTALDLAKSQPISRVITKDVARFMSACDLGVNWDRLAKAPIILIFEDGQIRLPTAEENNFEYLVWDRNKYKTSEEAFYEEEIKGNE